MRVTSLLFSLITLAVLAALSGLPRSFAEELPWLVSPVPAVTAVPAAPAMPDWLRAHAGSGEGQIAPMVLQRARALYQK